MDKKEITDVLEELLTIDKPAFILLKGLPIDTVREVVKQKKYNWTETEIAMVGGLLNARYCQEIEVLRNMKLGNDIIKDVRLSNTRAFTTTMIMHIVTFALGIALIISSVVAAFSGFELWTPLFGVFGISAILFLFIRQPITGVYRSIGSAIQGEIIYSSYIKQLSFWSPYVFSNTDDDKFKVMQEIENCTIFHIDLIQKYCEREAKNKYEIQKKDNKSDSYTE